MMSIRCEFKFQISNFKFIDDETGKDSNLIHLFGEYLPFAFGRGGDEEVGKRGGSGEAFRD